MTAWHIITGEYPPQPGGVSDYTRLVARGLAEAGDPVVVWAPPLNGTAEATSDESNPPEGGSHRSSEAESPDPGIDVRRLPDRFGPRSLRVLSERLNHARTPHRVLVQYVPHAFGWKAANVPFCLWLRTRRRDDVWVMFHEVAFPLEPGAGVALNALAIVNRLMASLVAKAARRAFVSIPAWRAGVGAVTPPGTPVIWLPVPSGIPVVDDAMAVQAIRARVGKGRPIIGHFGTYGGLIKPLVEECLTKLVELVDCRVLLLGRGSERIARSLIDANPRLIDRMQGTGMLTADQLSRHVSACDVMLQPYPDGVSGRRTSAMVALAHGVPMVTTAGHLTEPEWEKWEAAVLVPANDLDRLASATAALVVDPARRTALAGQAKALYDEQFDLRHTITALRASA